MVSGLGICAKKVVVDARHHMLGQLLSIMAKELLNGMIPHKTKCGVVTLARFKVYEGIPSPYDKIKRMVIPDALKNLKRREKRLQVAYERRRHLNKLRVKARKVIEEKLDSQLDILASVKY
ncbi:hypothetical protein SLE2022_210030 [Rubroshorea leprosula]